MSRRASARPRSAVVHDWFVTDGGADQCAVELATLLPAAKVYTSFFDRHVFGDRIDPARVSTWPLQRILGATSRFRSLLPLYPLYFSVLDLSHLSLVVSSSIAFAKAVRTGPNTLHVSYVYTPVRYAWDLDNYLRGSGYRLPSRAAAMIVRPLLRSWDRATANRPDIIVAISHTVQARIERLWHRESEVIYPPVDVRGIRVSDRDEGYLFVAARMLAYRRLDLAVGACRRLGRRLIVAGDGPERRHLESIAGPDTSFTGHVSRAALMDLFAGCSAYLVPGAEDFGIAPVEAMAAGKPVVAYAEGGATETIVDGITGTFFDEPNVESFVDAIQRLDKLEIDRTAIRHVAEAFDRDIFVAKWRDLFERLGVERSLYLSE